MKRSRSPKRRAKRDLDDQKNYSRPKKTSKRGPSSFKSTTELFRKAGHRTQLQHLRNELRSNECLKKQRYGFRLLWRSVPKDMKRYKIPKPGSFDPKNCHRGVMWGWPKECSLTNVQARTLLFNAYKQKSLTMSQLVVVRKSLSYAWELTGGLPGGNYPGVKEVWKIVSPQQTRTQIHHVLPERIPTVAELIKAFTKDWTPASAMCFMRHCIGFLTSHDLFIFGLRSTEDMRRVKLSSRHDYDWDAGWACTSFLGGRCKLAGVKKGTRPWKIWRVCHCPGKHVRPPAMFVVGKDGNPTSPLNWSSTCPVAVQEFLFSYQWKKKRHCYVKWLKSGRMGASNVKDVAGTAISWMNHQLEKTTGYNRNSGRKSLARWCSHLNVKYHESFQIHGDLAEVWSKSYQPDMEPSDFKGRSQSADPMKATLALRRFANLLGRGVKAKPKLSKSDRFSSGDHSPRKMFDNAILRNQKVARYHLLKALGKPGLADRIATELPSDSDED